MGGSATAGTGGAPTGVAGTGAPRRARAPRAPRVQPARLAQPAGRQSAALRAARRSSTPTSCWRASTPTARRTPRSGPAGVVKLDLGTGAQVGGRDAPWGIAKDAQDRLHVFAARKNIDGRTDSDRVVVRLSANGARRHDVRHDGLPHAERREPERQRAQRLRPARRQDRHVRLHQPADRRRHADREPDRARASQRRTPPRPVVQVAPLVRRHRWRAAAPVAQRGAAAPAAGTLDTTFGVGGIVNSNPFSSTDPLMLWGMAEAYGVARQSTGAYVTTGYGRIAPSGQVNVRLLPLLAAGVFDTTWARQRHLREGPDQRQRPRPQHHRAPRRPPADRRQRDAHRRRNVDGMLMILTAERRARHDVQHDRLQGLQVRRDERSPGRGAVRRGGVAERHVRGRRRLPQRGHRRRQQRRRRAGHPPARRHGTEFAAAVPFSTTAERPLLGGDVRRQQQDRRRRASSREGTDNFLAVARFNTDGTPRHHVRQRHRHGQDQRRRRPARWKRPAAWSCSRAARSSSAAPSSTSRCQRAAPRGERQCGSLLDRHFSRSASGGSSLAL